MSDEIKHGNTPPHGDFERQDIRGGGIIVFLLGLAAATFLIHLLLVGLYDVLDKRARINQPATNPLVTSAPEDTRKIPPKYAESAFPDPRLESDERTQLNDIRVAEEQRLNSYGWVDEKAGTVHIPIEQAMDLLVQRGLPTHAASDSGPQQSAKPGMKKQAAKKDPSAKSKERKGKKS